MRSSVSFTIHIRVAVPGSQWIVTVREGKVRCGGWRCFIDSVFGNGVLDSLSVLLLRRGAVCESRLSRLAQRLRLCAMKDHPKIICIWFRRKSDLARERHEALVFAIVWLIFNYSNLFLLHNARA